MEQGTNLEHIIELIEKHHLANPAHGIDCACMDKYIQMVRREFTSSKPECQRRVNYVLRTAINNP